MHHSSPLKRHSHLVSLFFMVTACIISVREYRKEHTFLQKINFDEAFENTALDFVPDIDRLGADDSVTLTTEAKTNTENQPYMRTLQLSKGDTLESVLTESGASKADIDQIVAAIQHKYNLRRIKTGQALVVKIQNATKTQPFQLQDIEMNISNTSILIVTRTAEGGYEAKIESLNLKPVLRHIEGRIHSSFYSTALKQGAPANIVQEAISSLSYVMNFQHGIKKDDTFQILFEEQRNRHGQVVKTGNLRFVSFVSGKTEHRIYKHKNNGQIGYFDQKGYSIVRGLLQTPLDASKMRITSGYGMRLHPIHGYNRNHKGVDIGAPTGTAIKAAGDGVIVKYGYYGEYGNFVKIRHGNGYETAYGHLSRYEKGLSVGSHVKQNQVIGYVGATGSATGPHLHFEVIYNGSNVNPMSVKKMPVTQLVGKDLEKFKKTKNEIDTYLVSNISGTHVAELPHDAEKIAKQPTIG